MIQRIVTALIGLPALLGIVWIGGYLLTALVAAVAALAAWELCRMAGSWGQRPFTVPAIVLVAMLAASGHLAAASGAVALAPVVSVAAAFAALTLLLGVGVRRQPFESILVTACTVMFIGGALCNASLLGGSDGGRIWIFFLLAVTFATDTGAFLVGRTVGSRRLAPSISPGKTWEGAIGGLASSLLAGAIFALVAGGGVHWLAIAPVLGVTGQIGDLFESRLKRLAGFDDSGAIFPGHGGILDRLDSLSFNLITVGLLWTLLT